MKRLFTLMILVGFLGGAFFSISAMNHSHRSLANSECPLSPIHTPVCPEDALSLASHYISMYQSFVNVLASSVVTQALMAVLLFVIVSCSFRKYIASIQYLLFCFWWRRRNFDAGLYKSRGITRWLSLLINSPSFN